MRAAARSSIQTRGVRAVYRRDAKGASNIDDLIGAGAPAPQPGQPAPASTGGAMRFDVSAVQLEDLRLRLADAMNDVDGELQLKSLTTGRLAHQAQTPVSLSATVQLVKPQAMTLAVDGRIEHTEPLRAEPASPAREARTTSSSPPMEPAPVTPGQVDGRGLSKRPAPTNRAGQHTPRTTSWNSRRSYAHSNMPGRMGAC